MLQGHFRSSLLGHVNNPRLEQKLLLSSAEAINIHNAKDFFSFVQMWEN